MPMTILQIHNRYQWQGGEDLCVEEERSMLERRGHRVLTYERDNGEIAERGSIGKAWLPLEAAWSRRTTRDVVGLVRSARPDVAHVHNTVPLVSPSVYWTLKSLRVPVVQTLHNYRLFCPAGTCFRSGRTCEECSEHSLFRSVRYGCYRASRAQSAVLAGTLALHRRLGTWTEKIDAYIALTEFGRRLFVRSGLPLEKIVIKPNFLGEPPEPRYDHDGYAVFVGRLSPEKGVEALLGAWKLGAHLPLRVIGDGPLRQHLLDRIEREDIRGVHLLGPMSPKDCLKQVRGAAFLAFPSVWYEGFGRVVVEAYACGKPVIATRLGSMREVVVDGTTGLLVDTGNLQELARAVARLEDEGRRREMGQAARREFEARYTEDRNYELLRNIYERVSAPALRDMSPSDRHA